MRSRREGPDRARGHGLQVPRWLVDERFDAAMAGIADGGWRDELPAIGLRALLVPAMALCSWLLILWGAARIW